MFIVYLYALLNIFVAIVTISAEHEYEKMTTDVPTGDLEFYKRPEPNPVGVWIMFPIAFLIYKVWILFCRTINMFC